MRVVIFTMLYNYQFLSIKQKNRGFTLIELLVVISIIGLLAAVVGLSLQHQRAKVRDVKRLTDLTQLKTALALYQSDQGSYPSSTEDIWSLGTADEGETAYTCLSNNGLEPQCTGDKVFMSPITGDPSPDEYYFYSSEDGSTYRVDFHLEVGTDTLPINGDDSFCLAPNGFTVGGCE